MRCAPSVDRYAVSRLSQDMASSRSGPGCVRLTIDVDHAPRGLSIVRCK
jgi:hypothetical protein